MINTLNPSSTLGHDEKKGEILERIQKEYGRPEEKQREAVKKLGKDEFFKIMVTQIQHQDPLKPYQNEEMAAQLAQFSALEQMVNVNQNLEKLTQSQLPMHQLGAAGLIGKFVTSDSSRIIHAEGRSSELAFELPADAKDIHINVLNEKGEIVRELAANDLKKGPAKVMWDGKKSNNLPAGSGTYMFNISASTNGKPIEAVTKKTSVVHGISFDGKETILLTGDVRNPQKLPLKSVSRIVDSNETAKAASSSQNGLPPELAALVDQAKSQGIDEAKMAEMINQVAEQESPAQGENTGLEAKYAPVDIKEFRKGNEKVVTPPPLSNEQIAEAIANANDLSGANPNGAAIREGVRPPSMSAQDEMSGANQAARQFHTAAAGADGGNLPSSGDGTTAGKWTE